MAKAKQFRPAYEYQCLVMGWKDGDTCTLEVDLGFKIIHRTDCRVYGVNCPEVHSKSIEEKERGLAAMRWAMQTLPPGEFVKVRSYKSGEDKFGRWLVVITLEDGRDFAKAMIEAGHAKSWDGVGVKPI